MDVLTRTRGARLQGLVHNSNLLRDNHTINLRLWGHFGDSWGPARELGDSAAAIFRNDFLLHEHLESTELLRHR